MAELFLVVLDICLAGLIVYICEVLLRAAFRAYRDAQASRPQDLSPVASVIVDVWQMFVIASVSVAIVLAGLYAIHWVHALEEGVNSPLIRQQTAPVSQTAQPAGSTLSPRVPPPPLSQLIARPDFEQLSPEGRRQVLAALYPEFREMSPEEQDKLVYASPRQIPRRIQAPAPSPASAAVPAKPAEFAGAAGRPGSQP